MVELIVDAAGAVPINKGLDFCRKLPVREAPLVDFIQQVNSFVLPVITAPDEARRISGKTEVYAVKEIFHVLYFFCGDLPHFQSREYLCACAGSNAQILMLECFGVRGL